MASNYWFLDRDHQQTGPVGEDEFVQLIAQGVITPETQIWTSGMSEWRKAGEVDGMGALFGPPGAPSAGRGATSVPPISAWPTVTAGVPTGPLRPDIPVWGLFGRSLLVLIGALLVIPSPWTGTMFYKWLGERISLPNGERLTFAGQPGDIWWVFVAWALSPWIGGQGEIVIILISLAAQPGDIWWDFVAWAYPLWKVLKYGGLISLLISAVAPVLVLKWFCEKLGSENGRLRLAFVGGILPFIGWNILLVFSFLTIIGWAWVMKFMAQGSAATYAAPQASNSTGPGSKSCGAPSSPCCCAF